MGGTAVGTLGLYSSGSGMGSGLVARETCTGDIGGPGILRFDTQGGPFTRLGVNGGEGRKLVHGRSERSKGSHVGEGRRGGRSISLLRLVEGGNGLHVNVLRLEVLVETSGRRPGTRGFDRCEKFIQGQLYCWTDDVEMIDIVECQTFSEADRIGTRGGGMVEGTGIKVVREEGRETEGGGGLVVLVDNWLSGVGSLAAALGQGGFFILIIHNVVRNRGSGAAGRLVKFGRGLQVWFLDWTGHGGRSGLVDAEGELHALDGSRSTVEASLAVALLLSSTLPDHISRVVPFESRGLELNDAPAKATSQETVGKTKGISHASLSLCRVCRPYAWRAS